MTEQDKAETQQNQASIWCVGATVRMSIPFGEGAKQTRRGTNKFHGGAKVYLAGAFWGTGAERVTVVGHYRGKGYITASLQVRYLTNFRAELVYSPTVISRLTTIHISDSFKWDNSEKSKANAEQVAEQFTQFSDKLHTERLLKRHTLEQT